MARPTKRKTKHRGNAAGMVEGRGGAAGKPGAKGPGGKVDPRMREPTWKSAFLRALVASGLFIVILAVVARGSIVSTVFVGILLLAVYTPFGYYTDRYFYRRRLRKLEAARAARR